ncbi:aldo/keto reductase [Parvicella tangerina]|uniref:1-deoxyxylulose-5-phosphate synthase YajO n=1 Tax=Parvicella tangerina TaxID=2829795 RepID=A0A916JLT7_9FLAO|nr:aldo/keto reductase [Parvicella tangerina]CAG5080752.1 1-deoxyxylulose-5-phosphate synthase YajO [Parvicella tangerina]
MNITFVTMKQMNYKLLGRTGIRVSELCLGTMTFGTDWGWGSEKEEAKKIYDEFLKRGGNFFDTANIYTKGTAEKYLGEFIGTDREEMVIATKYSLSEAGEGNQAGNHRKNMMQSVEASLKRLNTDYIDLYYVHAWDYTVHPEELMRNLEYLVASGKVLSIGLSDTPAWIMSKCNTIAEQRGWTPFAATQVEYCLSERTAEREIMPCTKGFDMTFCGFGPLGAGLLSGKYLHESNEPRRMDVRRSHRLSPQNLELSRKLVELCQEWNLPATAVAIRWTMQQFKNSSPIFGARNLNQMQENMKALDFELSDEQMTKLNAISAIGPNNPNDFLQLPRIKEILYGNQLDRIEF